MNIAQLFGLPEHPVGLSSQVIRQEVYDSDMYHDIINDSPALQDTLNRGSEIMPVYGNFLQDVFLSLFKLEPELLSEGEIEDRVMQNRSLMEALFNSKDFQRLRTMTVLDPLSSILGTQVISEKTLQHMNNGGTGGSDVKEALTAIAKDTADEVSNVVENMRTWGIDPGEPGLRVSFQNKRKALEKLRSSQRLQKFTDLVGRFRTLARQIYRRKGADGSHSISGVTTGGDLERVLPSEKMMLGHGVTRMDFIRRYHQRELLQYKRKDNPAWKGPLVVCCDVSGSMAGKAEEWSKATMLAMADIAQRQKRDYACILFNNMVVETWVIPKGTWNPSAIIDMAEVAPSGSTNFKAPLERALEIINESRFRKADIVFITDGHCSVDQTFLNRFNETKVRKGFMVFTVLINIEESLSTTIEQFSDEVMTLSSLAQLDEDAAAKLFTHVDGAVSP